MDKLKSRLKTMKNTVTEVQDQMERSGKISYIKTEYHSASSNDENFELTERNNNEWTKDFDNILKEDFFDLEMKTPRMGSLKNSFIDGIRTERIEIPDVSNDIKIDDIQVEEDRKVQIIDNSLSSKIDSSKIDSSVSVKKL